MFKQKKYEYSDMFKYKMWLKQINKADKIKLDYDLMMKIDEWNKQGYLTAIVHMTGDLAHPSHIDYIKTIREKIKDKFGVTDDDIKLVLGLEHEKRTLKRKGKRPILNDEERKYQWENIKGVDYVYIRDIPMNMYPSDIAMMLNIDVLILHEEYIDNLNKYLRVAKKMRRANLKTKTMIIKTLDTKKYLGKDFRNENGISTTNIVKRVIERQRDLVEKILNSNKDNDVG